MFRLSSIFLLLFGLLGAVHPVSAQDPDQPDSTAVAAQPAAAKSGDPGYFTSLTEAMKNPEQVEVLVLKGRKLDSIPSVIFSMKNLIYLDLSRNRIDSIPPGIGSLAKLNHLELSNNKLMFLPDEIGQLTALTYLGLNRNMIVKLPASIGDLSELKVLELWDNELEDVPDEISKLQNLELLELRGILFSDETQARIDELVVKSAKINLSPSCACKN